MFRFFVCLCFLEFRFLVGRCLLGVPVSGRPLFFSVPVFWPRLFSVPVFGRGFLAFRFLTGRSRPGVSFWFICLLARFLGIYCVLLGIFAISWRFVGGLWRFIGGLSISRFAFRVSMVIFAGISVYFICISLITGITGARFFLCCGGVVVD
jgi:hypothetical protein